MNRPLPQRIRIARSIVLGMLKRHKTRVASICAVLVVLILVTVQLHRVYAIFPTDPGYIEGMVGQYQNQSLPPAVEQVTSMGLTKLAPDGQAQPAAAKSWAISSDGKEYLFTLRTDLSWHDGSKFTAHDLTNLFSGTEAKSIATTILSDDKVAFKLQNAYAPFPTILAKPLFKGEELLGLGEYKITKIDYWEDYITAMHLSRVQSTGDPKHDTIVFRFYPTVSEMLIAFRLGELRGLYGFFDPQTLASWDNVTYYQHTNYASFVGIFLNTKDPLLIEKTVRQALTFALPKDILPGEETLSPIPPSSWAFNPEVKQYVYDTNHAKEILNRDTRDTSQLKEAIRLTTSPVYADLAREVAQAWEKIGFSVTVEVTTQLPENFQAALVRQEMPADPDQYALWHSLQKTTNLAHYDSERIDKLLEDARAITDLSTRRAKYLDFQRFIVEDAPAIFLYYPAEGLLLKKRYDTDTIRSLHGFSKTSQKNVTQ